MFEADLEGDKIEQEEPRGRGRPPGVKNGEGEGMDPIKNWTPKHDLVIQLHVGMHGKQEIADLTDLTPTRVSQILNDPQGKALVRVAQERLRIRMAEEIEDGLVSLCVKALDNIRETIELEGLAHGSDFKKHQDKLSLEVLKGRGHLSKDTEAQKREQAPLDAMLAGRLVEALEKSNEAAQFAIDQKKEKEIVVEANVPKNTTFKLVESK